MRTPLGVGANEIAWNSFAYVGQNANTGGPLLPAEPIKVGIQTEPNGTLPFDGGSRYEFSRLQRLLRPHLSLLCTICM